MSKVEADLCITCPARGLCLGDVSLSVSTTYYGDGLYEGASIQGVDSDGVTTEIGSFVPEHYDAKTGFLGRIQTQKTNPSNATRSDEIFHALSDAPETLLEDIARRAAACQSPDGYERESGFATTYAKVCRATAAPVLRKLIEQRKSS